MIALFLGGAGSGKSAAAERWVAARSGPVTYVATFVPAVGDADMDARIEAHRARRPSDWGVVETGTDLPGVVAALDGTILIDSIGTWVACAPDFAVDADGLCGALRCRAGDAAVVSDEVGLGVHPGSAAGRRFRDVMGPINAALAAVADEAWLVVAGRALALGSL